MRQVHRVGEKTFVDYSGKRPHLIDPSAGERIVVELFVGVLGASSYTYAEATLTQRVPDGAALDPRALAQRGLRLAGRARRTVRLWPGLQRPAIGRATRLRLSVD